MKHSFETLSLCWFLGNEMNTRLILWGEGAFKGEPNRQHILGLIDRNEITTTITTGCCFRSRRKLYRIQEEEGEEEALQLLQVQAVEFVFVF